MYDSKDSIPDDDRDDVDPAEALGGAAGLPLPEGQVRGVVPTDRDAPGTDAAPEAVTETHGDAGALADRDPAR